jgi:hypothetical protein
VEQNSLELLINNNNNNNNNTDFNLHLEVGYCNKKDVDRQGITYSYNAKDNESEGRAPIAETYETQVLDKEGNQTSNFGIDCWSIQPDGLNSVLTEINARLDTILNSSIFYWIWECDILTYGRTNEIGTKLFSEEGESNIQITDDKCGSCAQGQRKARNKYKKASDCIHDFQRNWHLYCILMPKSEIKKIFIGLLTLFMNYIQACGVIKNSMFHKK